MMIESLKLKTHPLSLSSIDTRTNQVRFAAFFHDSIRLFTIPTGSVCFPHWARKIATYTRTCHCREISVRKRVARVDMAAPFSSPGSSRSSAIVARHNMVSSQP